MADPDAFTLRKQVTPSPWATVGDPRIGDIDERAGVAGELGLEGGLVHHRLWVDGVDGCPERHHLTELGFVSSDLVQQCPLKVNDSTDQSVPWIVGTRMGARHLDVVFVQWREEPLQGASLWQHIAAHQDHSLGGSRQIAKKSVYCPSFASASGFEDHPYSGLLLRPAHGDAIGTIGAAAADHTDAVVPGFIEQARQQVPQVARFIVGHHADFGLCHVLEIACSMPNNREQQWTKLILVAFVAHLGLGMWFVERGLLNGDEGWYLYAARQIALGLQPYSDFGFFQMPVFPVVVSGTIDAGPGALLAARWMSWLTLALGTGVATLAATRVAGKGGALIAVLGMGLHPLVVASGVLAKPFGLTILLLAAGLFLVAGTHLRPARVVSGFVLMALAVGCRLSVLAPVLILAMAQRGRLRVVAMGGLMFGLALSGQYFIGVEPGLLWDQLVGFHLGDGGSLSSRGGWMVHLVTVWGLSVAGWIPGDREESIPGLLPASVVAVLVHVLPAHLHVEHLVAVSPLLIVAVAARWGRRIHEPRVFGCGIALMALTSASSARFVHLDSTVATVQQTMDLGAYIREHTPKDMPLLTQQLALAVESDRSVLPGLEMGRFGWSPELTKAEAVRSHRMSIQRLDSAISGPIGGIVIAGGDFDEVRRAAVLYAAQTRFPNHRRVEMYGQFLEPIDLYVPEGETLWMQ